MALKVNNSSRAEKLIATIDNSEDDLSYLFRDIKGYSNKELEKSLMKRLIRIKEQSLLGSQFKENHKKGKRKGTRFYYFQQIRDAFNKGKIDLVKALITYARVDFKVNKKSRQTLWRLKKELLDFGLPENIVMDLYL